MSDRNIFPAGASGFSSGLGNIGATAGADRVSYQQDAAFSRSSHRSLATALSRLRELRNSLEGSNDRTGRFLEGLVGVCPGVGNQMSSTGDAQQAQSYVTELHDIIDRIERAAEVASSRSFALLVAADDPSLQTLSASAQVSGLGRASGA